MSELYHHGVAGQKWGVRNGPPYPLHRRERDRVVKNRQYVDAINEIARTLSDEQKEKLGMSLHEDFFDEPNVDKELSSIQKIFMTKIDDVPAAFLTVYVDDSTREAQVAIATRNDPKYRNKGYASDLATQLDDYLNRYGKKTMDEVVWWAREDNTPSRKIAESHGYKDTGRAPDPQGRPFVRYSKKL